MATISNTPRPGYVWDATDNVWYPIGVGGHSHSEIAKTIADAKGDLIVGTAADTVDRLAAGNSGEQLVADSSTSTGLRYQGSQAAGKNVIINGAMTISQRGTTFTPTTNLTYTLDRWLTQLTVSSKFSVAQSTSNTTNTNAYNALITSLSSYTVLAGDTFAFSTRIEGYNFRQFAFGTANAKTIAISFEVRSSLTGTFSGSLTNSAEDRSYPFTYTISTANTWEQKSVIIAGDTSGTWLYSNDVGAKLFFNLGAGSTYSGTAGAWTGSGKYAATGSVSVVATNTATLQITNVQFEAGSVATAFQTATGTIQGELAACQRYYFRNTGAQIYLGSGGIAGDTINCYIQIKHPITMRVSPTAVDYSLLMLQKITATYDITSITISKAQPDITLINPIVASGLTAATQSYMIMSQNNAAAYLGLSAEL